MNNIERVEPKVVDGIEFYCSKDGEHLGMSQVGLAKFCGVAENAVRYISESVRNKQGIKELECLWDKEFYLANISSNQQAKVINAEACQEIVWYYAMIKKNPMAIISLKKFASLGIRDFIRKITGFEKPTVEMPNNILQEILMTVKEIQTKAEVLDKFNKATVTLPGLQQQFKDYANQDNVLDGHYFSLAQWLESRDVFLSHAQKCQLGRMVSEVFKVNRQAPPKRVTNCKLGIPKKGASTVYKPSDVPMLEVALSKLFPTT